MNLNYILGFLTAYLSLGVPGQVFAETLCDFDFKSDLRVTLTDERIDESSGLVASRRDRGMFWTHNDSGDVGRVFGIDSTGETRAIGVLEVDGKDFQPNDAEDIAFGPCTESPDGCLFLADVGDNDKERPAVFVYQFVEPKIGETKIDKFVTTEIKYPDGAYNVEALLIDPNSMLDGQGPMGYLVEKTEGDARVWRVRLSGGKQKAKQVATLKRPKSGILGGLITGGEASPDGSFIVLRTYESILMLCSEKSGRSSTKKFVNMFTNSKIKSIIPPDSVQAEAIAVGLNGAIWFTSENTPTPLVSMKAIPPIAKTRAKSCGCVSISNRPPTSLLGLIPLLMFTLFRHKKKTSKEASA